MIKCSTAGAGKLCATFGLPLAFYKPLGTKNGFSFWWLGKKNQNKNGISWHLEIIEIQFSGAINKVYRGAQLCSFTPALSATAFTAAGELSSYNRDHVACKTKKILHLVLGRNSVQLLLYNTKGKNYNYTEAYAEWRKPDHKSTHGSLFISPAQTEPVGLNKSERSLRVTVNGQGAAEDFWTSGLDLDLGGGYSRIDIRKKLPRLHRV